MSFRAIACRLRPGAALRQRPLVGVRSTPERRTGSSGLAPMPAPQHGGHFLLHGTPYSLQTCAHPGFAVPVDTPLAHILRARLEMQRPRHTATRERPVERLPRVARQAWEAADRRFAFADPAHCRPASRQALGFLAGVFEHAQNAMRIVNDPPTTR